MAPAALEAVLWMYRDRLVDLKRDGQIRDILVSRRHKKPGVPPHHPYSRVSAIPIVFDETRRELREAREYYQYKRRCLYCDMLRQEIAAEERVVSLTPTFAALVPYAARGPLETWILPRQHGCSFEEGLTAETARDLARDWVQARIRRHALVVDIHNLFKDQNLGEEEKVLFPGRIVAGEDHFFIRIDLRGIAHAEGPEVHHVLVFLVEEMVQIPRIVVVSFAVEPVRQPFDQGSFAMDVQAEEIHRLMEAQPFLSLRVQNERVQVERSEGNSLGSRFPHCEMQAEHDHARIPEKQNVVTADEQRRGIKRAKVGRIVGPAQRRERPKA